MGVILFSAGTFWPFLAKMYRLGVFNSQLVHFSLLWRKCTGWGFMFSAGTFLAILCENVPAEGLLFSSGTFWPF